jgi:hypothetical protein
MGDTFVKSFENTTALAVSKESMMPEVVPQTKRYFR